MKGKEVFHAAAPDLEEGTDKREQAQVAETTARHPFTCLLKIILVVYEFYHKYSNNSAFSMVLLYFSSTLIRMDSPGALLRAASLKKCTNIHEFPPLHFTIQGTG